MHTFITLDDALAAWDDVLAATERAHAEGRESRVVVIGGGLIGMKAAEALSHHADRIDVFDRSPRILPAVLDVDGAAVVSRLMEPHGIFCHPSMSVDEMLGEGERVTHVRLTDGSDEACDMVIVAVGVRPGRASLPSRRGAEQGRGLICGPEFANEPARYVRCRRCDPGDRYTRWQRASLGAVAQCRSSGSHCPPCTWRACPAPFPTRAALR